MGFSIHYRSTDTMHPALAYEIKQHAARLIEGYLWRSCEPVQLNQQTDGHLSGASKPNFFPAETDTHLEHKKGVPDGTVLALAEVLCTLSREHGVDWDIGHDYEPEPIGRISHGQANDDLVEQLETLGSVGDLLEGISEPDLDLDLDALEEEEPGNLSAADRHEQKLAQWTSAEFGAPPAADDSCDDLDDDAAPRVLKFPTPE